MQHLTSGRVKQFPNDLTRIRQDTTNVRIHSNKRWRCEVEAIFRKYANVARILILRYRLRGKLMDLHALSAQQVADLYLGDAILGEIRSLKNRLDVCVQEQGRFVPKASHSSDDII
jgi:hypothetical protein